MPDDQPTIGRTWADSTPQFDEPQVVITSGPAADVDPAGAMAVEAATG